MPGLAEALLGAMKSLRNFAIIFVGCIALAATFAFILGLLSPAARWNVGLWLGQRDYNYITELRDQLQREPMNSVVLAKILARTENPNAFYRGNAIGVLMQLSYYNTPTGRQIHSQALPVFIRALDEKRQSIKRTGLEGLENLGPYAISAIPDIKRKLSDPDPIIQQEAERALGELEKFQTNGPNAKSEGSRQKIFN